MKNALIKLLGGVTQADHKAATGDAFIDAVRTDIHSIEQEIRRTWRLALRDIAACETPSANATVRRMARIAREALHRG